METSKNKFTGAFSWFARLSWGKKGIILLIIIALLAVVAEKVYSAQTTKPQYQTTTVSQGSVISTVTESGNVSSTSQISVGSPSDGVIQEVYVKNGDKVTAGQNLFKVKATATPQAQASAYASYLTAVNSAKSAQQSKQTLQASLEKDRQAVLDAQEADNNKYNSVNPSTKTAYTQLEQDSIGSALTSAHETFTADETKYNQADTAIAAANAQLNSAELAYQATQDSVVTAPVDGTIANLSSSVGSSVASSGNSNSTSSSSNSSSSSTSSSSSSSSSPVLIIGNFTKLNITAQVSEDDISKIHIGEKATITLDAFPNDTYVGEVASVDTIGTSTSGVVNYSVYINITEPPTSIQSGMTATAVIQTDRKDDTLYVPSAAVHTLDGASTVTVLKDGKATSVDVTTGISSDSDTEITSGLSEGETIVVGTVSTTRTTGASSTASPFGSTTRTGGFGGGFTGAGGGTGTRTGGTRAGN